MTEVNVMDAPAATPKVPRDNQIPKLSQRELWACQVRKDFERLLLRIVRMYEKSNPAISAVAIKHDQNGRAVALEVIPK
jgi:hypothetical protein